MGNILFFAAESTGRDFSEYFINFISGFFGTPALLIGLFALIGTIIQRKKITEIITSVFKTVIGFLIIGGGAGIVSGAIGKFGKAFELLFSRQGYVANNDVMPGLLMSFEQLQWIATAGSLILIFGMLLNLVIARISQVKFVYLTGHSAWYFSTMLASVMAMAGMQKADMWLVVIIGAMLASVWMIISPAILNRHMMVITKGNKLGLAHTGSLTYALSGYIGEAVYKARKGKVRSTENVNFPKGLNFLRNTNVSIALTMLILFMVVYFSAWAVRGDQAMINKGIVGANDSIFVQGMLQAFTFAAGVEVLLIGVRMFIAEITPAFKGISDKLVRDAKPGIDCPIVFPYAPNAVIMGFIASVIGGFVAFGMNIGISAAIGAEGSASIWAAIIIPSIVPHFFTGATSGVFGNAKGGILGCWLGSFVNGFLISLVPWIFVGLQMIQPEIGGQGIVWGDADFILGIIPWFIIKYMGGQYVLLGLTILLWGTIPAIGYFLHQNKLKKNAEYKEKYIAVNDVRKKFSIMSKNEKSELKNLIESIKLEQISKKEIKEKIESVKAEHDKKMKKADRDLEKMVDSIRNPKIEEIILVK
ncbi:PTS system, ascorbate-specific IIC component [Williamsoniiplasma luminosum]|uniref:Ascorbate-specific PTS system EIIC component n=1 Tax=Williamsoniiplasma luminosum TaxID=214888 RepID=A0A2K8NTG8_9MOLU|nr:PTS ascorbate transporter subunit IIC [Williamsoniiplasma luminosum]ATZ17130.1 PTS system, ascorbate-specific IIC component [Williamsoniiplasma luminosum]